MKNLFMIAAAAAVLFTSCAKDEQIAPENKIAKLGFASITAEAMTRATTALASDFMFNLTGTDYPDVVAREVTYATSTYTITGDPIYVSAARTLTAWAPTSATPEAGEPNDFTLTPGTTAVDFLYQKNMEVTPTNCETVAIAMKHAMAKITFKVVFPTDYSGPKNLAALTLKGTPGASIFNISTEAWAAPAAAADLTIVTASTEITENGFSTLVVPMATVDNTTLSIDCTVNTSTAVKGVNITGLTKLEAGKNYVVTITVTDKTLSITGATQEDWVDGGAGSAPLS